MIPSRKIALVSLMLLVLSLLPLNRAFAQLRFDRTTHDFGTIAEAGGKVECRFRATNEGAEPVVILDVVTTCGCTVPTFSRKPLRSGESTEITVSYDPYNRPGTIDRKLHVYDARRNRLAVLTLTGRVTPRERSVEERYPIALREGVRLSNTLATFTYIYIGQSLRSALSLINTADEPRTVELRHTAQSGLLEVEYPTRLAAGERSAINFHYHIPTAAPRYGTIRDLFEVWIDGVRVEPVILVHGIGVDRPTQNEKECPAKMELSENILKFGAVKAASHPLRRTLTLRNVGCGALQLRAVEGGKLQTSFRREVTIPPGAEHTLELLFDPATADYGFFTEQLMLITNDPDRPMRRVRVTATVEE